MYSKVLMKDRKTGTKFLKEMILPVPAYEIGQVAGYGVDPDEPKYCIESEIVGFEVEVIRMPDKSGNNELTVTIGYHMINGDLVLQHEVDYIYNAEKDEFEDTTLLLDVAE